MTQITIQNTKRGFIQIPEGHFGAAGTPCHAVKVPGGWELVECPIIAFVRSQVYADRIARVMKSFRERM